LFDVDVDQLARPLALVADDLGLGVEGAKLAEAAAAQDPAHGRDRAAEPAGDGRPGQALAPEPVDLGYGRVVEAGRAALRPRRAVGQAGVARLGMAVTPLAHGLGVDAEG